MCVCKVCGIYTLWWHVLWSWEGKYNGTPLQELPRPSTETVIRGNKAPTLTSTISRSNCLYKTLARTRRMLATRSIVADIWHIKLSNLKLYFVLFLRVFTGNIFGFVIVASFLQVKVYVLRFHWQYVECSNSHASLHILIHVLEFVVFIGNILSVVTVMQAFSIMEEEHALCNLFTSMGLGDFRSLNLEHLRIWALLLQSKLSSPWIINQNWDQPCKEEKLYDERQQQQKKRKWEDKLTINK